MRQGILDRHFKWFMTIPSLLFVALMMAFPIAYTFRLSFFSWSMSSTTPPEWVGLGNYSALLHDSRFLLATWRTFYFSAIALVFEVVLGVAIALLLNRDFRGQNLFKTIFLLPMVATPVAMGLVWLLIFEPTMGVANKFLHFFHIPPQLWLASPHQVLPSLALVDVWEWTPMISLIVLAGLSVLPSDPYEAAVVDGATPWQSFWQITLPLLKPTIIVAIMLRLIDVLKTFDIIYATTQGGPGNSSETLNIYGYILGFQYFKMGAASSLLVIFFAIVMGFTVLLLWVRKRMEV
jgi:multiple sugar transport system permease protein